ncbi:MAG: hypothetical protein KAY37_00955 [Phycisphaerae bacterium]|nr:hypothetical protein [Phycisphaerae bacterium]
MLNELRELLINNPLYVAVLASLPMRRGVKRMSFRAVDIAIDIRDCDGLACTETDVERAATVMRLAGAPIHRSAKQGLLCWEPDPALERLVRKLVREGTEEGNQATRQPGTK